MLDAALHALIKELIRNGSVDAHAMHASLMEQGEDEAAAFVGGCLVEVSAESEPAPAPTTKLRLVHRNLDLPRSLPKVP